MRSCCCACTKQALKLYRLSTTEARRGVAVEHIPESTVANWRCLNSPLASQARCAAPSECIVHMRGVTKGSRVSGKVKKL